MRFNFIIKLAKFALGKQILAYNVGILRQTLWHHNMHMILRKIMEKVILYLPAMNLNTAILASTLLTGGCSTLQNTKEIS